MKFVEQLERFKTMPENWDGNGAEKPDIIAIDRAIEFLNARPKTLTALADGNILLVFDADKHEIEIEFDSKFGNILMYTEKET